MTFLTAKARSAKLNHIAIDKLIERYPLIAYNEIEICLAINLFDALILLRFYFIIAAERE